MSNIVRDYFNSVSDKWANRDESFDTYPAAEVRERIVTTDLMNKYPLKRTRVKLNSMDLGCGAGQLVRKLLDISFNAEGIDISSNMIAEARKNLGIYGKKKDPEEVFKTLNVTEAFLGSGYYHVITAMGLSEYLPDACLFMKNVNEWLAPGGVAYVECRNRLFNAVTANNYTLAEIQGLADLIAQLKEVDKYSPVTDAKEIKSDIKWAFKNIESAVSKENGPPHGVSHVVEEIKYTIGMMRRQFTPEEMEALADHVGLKLNWAIYYHCHPFLPRFEKLFPRTFNRISYDLQPLGYTPLGASMCSAFVAILEKPL